MVGALTGNFSPELLNDVPLQFSTEEYKLMFLDATSCNQIDGNKLMQQIGFASSVISFLLRKI